MLIRDISFVEARATDLIEKRNCKNAKDFRFEFQYTKGYTMARSKIATLLQCSAAALLVVGCGGSTVNTTISGTVIGLSGGTSVGLTDNGSDTITVGANGAFTFDVQVASGSGYAVTIATQPAGEFCTVTNGSGTIDSNGDPVTNVVVSCVTTS